MQSGVNETLKNIKNGAKSFVVYGEPQSGKTEFMIALVCKLLDEKYETIFIIMNDNTELEYQNYDRFLQCKEMSASPKSAYEISNMEPSELKSGVQRIIFCRKNNTNLQNLLVACRFMKSRVIIDDEADYASPNSKINKEQDPSKINLLVNKLINDNGENGSYIGVTATSRLDVNTFLNKAKDWVFLSLIKDTKEKIFLSLK